MKYVTPLVSQSRSTRNMPTIAVNPSNPIRKAIEESMVWGVSLDSGREVLQRNKGSHILHADAEPLKGLQKHNINGRTFDGSTSFLEGPNLRTASSQWMDGFWSFSIKLKLATATPAAAAQTGWIYQQHPNISQSDHYVWTDGDVYTSIRS